MPCFVFWFIFLLVLQTRPQHALVLATGVHVALAAAAALDAARQALGLEALAAVVSLRLAEVGVVCWVDQVAVLGVSCWVCCSLLGG